MTLRDDSKIMIGVLAGAAAGFAAAVMFTPKKGADLRQSIVDSLDDLSEYASEFVAQGRDLIAELASQKKQAESSSSRQV